MSTLHLLLAVLATLVIIALSFYVGLLLKKIKSNQLHYRELMQQKQLNQEQSIEKRNQNIVDSIRFIATATTQKQCNISEAAIRITVLLETLQIEKPINIAETYPALTAMFEKVKDMPTHEERKKHPVKEIKILDARRELFEAEMEEALLQEAQQLSQFSL